MDKRQAEIDKIRLQLISRMDLFMEWGERSYKNTNDLKHEDTSDIIQRLAEHLVDNPKCPIRSAEGFEIGVFDEYDIQFGKLKGNCLHRIVPIDYKGSE